MLTTYESLSEWLRDYSPTNICNEDDVETKFILPLFRMLGFPDKCRRGKYPVDSYKRGTKGRKPEADQVYFSTSDHEKQDSNTALVVVECKAPNKQVLSDAIVQAQFYGEYLRHLYYVAANGYRLIVYRRHRFSEDELVFDVSIDDLRQKEILELLVSEFRYEVLLHAKQANIDPLLHKQYVELYSALQSHPDFVSIVNKRFESRFFAKRDEVTAVRPRTAVICQFPRGFVSGQCEIQFSSPLLQAANIKLDHQDVLANLFPGINSPITWNNRRYLHYTSDDEVELKLPKINLSIPMVDAEDLCHCLDLSLPKYRERILSTEASIRAWDFEYVFWNGFNGYCIAEVREWFWKLILKYANEVLDGQPRGIGDKKLYSNNIGIEIGSAKYYNHVALNPKASFYFVHGSVSSGYVRVIYHPHDLSFSNDMYEWEDRIGPDGIWTADFTERWFHSDLVPMVRKYYRDTIERYEQMDADEYGTIVRDIEEVRQSLYTKFDSVMSINALYPYVGRTPE